jgi:3-mercaptopyruvate sulfurtransferase SseA
MTMEELRIRQHEIPRDRDIILYCSCPNEVSSARMALFLRRSGILRVRPLLGGIDAWRERNYPMELRPVGIVSSSSSSVGSGNQESAPPVQILVTPEAQSIKAPEKASG